MHAAEYPVDPDDVTASSSGFPPPPLNDTPRQRVRVPASLAQALSRLEHAGQLDPVAERLSAVARRVGAGRRGSMLRGESLGHALHPLMTDFPLGCWMAASVVDILAPRSGRKAAQRLVGVGLMATVPTVLTGLAEYGQVRTSATRRVGAAHAAGNGAVAMAYLMSWRARHANHHLRGMLWAFAGGSGAWVTGYLGGHLSFARRVGTGERGMDLDPAM